MAVALETMFTQEGKDILVKIEAASRINRDLMCQTGKSHGQK
jgi:hypothetical protein